MARPTRVGLQAPRMNTVAASSPLPVARASRSWVTPVEIVVLGAIWGASFLFMRMAAPVFGAAPLVDVRLALGCAVLLPFLWKFRAQFPLKLWPKLALIGAINSAVPFVLFAWAAQRAPAGIGAICNSMTVLFTAIVGVLFFGEKISARRAAAALVGFLGVVVLASGKTAGASIGWAVAAATLTTSALLLLPFAIAYWPAHAISTKSWLATGALGVLCTGTAFVMYYRLIARVGASRAATVTYLVPVFGIAWAWMLLGEAVTPTMLAAGLLILGSVAFSQRAK